MQFRVCSVVIREGCAHAAIASASASPRAAGRERLRSRMLARPGPHPLAARQRRCDRGHDHRVKRPSAQVITDLLGSQAMGVLVDLDLAPRSQSITADRPHRSVRIAPASENLQRTPYVRRRCCDRRAETAWWRGALVDRLSHAAPTESRSQPTAAGDQSGRWDERGTAAVDRAYVLEVPPVDVSERPPSWYE
jgi:hypothetical protein